jgi:hypothetical protein
VAYFADFSDYCYISEGVRPQTKNIGWIEQYPELLPFDGKERLLELLWEFCKISVLQTRGLHVCGYCGNRYVVIKRGEDQLLLGSAEIRVFGEDGSIYASPNLIYHYISQHNYRPPDKFISALESGPRPPNSDYFDRLNSVGLEYSKTLIGTLPPK